MKFVPNTISRTIARTALTTQKNSPKLLFVVGMASMGATVFYACKATLQVDSILDEVEHDLGKIEITRATSQQLDVEYTDQDVMKRKIGIYLHASGELLRLYAPAIACGAITVAALTKSHSILNKRNAALVAAYTTIEKAFDEYRGRIREAYGEDREQEIYRDIQTREIENAETGKKSKVKLSNGGTPYSFLFDDNNRNWDPIPEYNLLFLKAQQQYANHRLQARGHIFLNEVLEALGIEHTPAGAVTGWIRGKGDDYVDFGIFNEAYEMRIVEFMTGREKAVWLDFNVDGVIYKNI